MMDMLNELERDCEAAVCACDDIVGSLDALDDFSITPEDDRSESQGGIPAEINFGEASSGEGVDDFADPDFDGLADFEEMY